MRPARFAPRSSPAASDGRLRDPDTRVAALAGLIAGTLGHHSIESLVRMPPAVMITTVALFAAALVRSPQRRALAAALITGIIAGWMLPAAAPGAVQSIVTHAAGRSEHNDLFDALDNLDARPATMLGRRVSVTGIWRPADRDSLATVSQRIMACCAADAVDVGFDVLPASEVAVRAGTRVRVAGIVGEVLREGETRYVLRDADVKPVSEESNGAR